MKHNLTTLLVILFFFIPGILMARDVSVDLRLNQQSVNVSDEVLVKVNIDQVADLKGINILLSFDNLRLKYKSITKETLISDFVEDIMPDAEQVKTTGKMEYMAVREVQGPGIDTPGGSILTIAFTAISPGEAWIKLEPNDVSLCDSIANKIPANSVTDRYTIQIGEIYKMKVFNYPNPAPDSEGNTIIRCAALAFLEGLEINIYDISGELVKLIKFEDFDSSRAPIYEYTWNCKNEADQDVANGTYILWAKASFKSSDDIYETWKIAIRH